MTAGYIIHFKFINPELNSADHWLFGISPEGIGTLGMLINFAVTILLSLVTAPPPQQVQELVEEIRLPDHVGPAHEVSA